MYKNIRIENLLLMSPLLWYIDYDAWALLTFSLNEMLFFLNVTFFL